MVWVYILKSEKNGRYYIGCSNDPDRRLLEHNAGKTESLKYLLPVKLVFKQGFKTSSEASKVESKLKKNKNRKILELIIRDCYIKGL